MCLIRLDVGPFRTMVKKPPPPFGLKLFYNMTESVISRKTAKFLLGNPVRLFNRITVFVETAVVEIVLIAN